MVEIGFHGMVPEQLHSDNGSEFVNEQVQEWCEENNVEFIQGAPWKPWHQGGVLAVVSSI
jgi:transposase InsO family protein